MQPWLQNYPARADITAKNNMRSMSTLSSELKGENSKVFPPVACSN